MKNKNSQPKENIQASYVNNKVATDDAVTTSENFKISQKTLGKIFFFSLLSMLILVWFSGYNIGYHQDEMDMNNYGKANFAFYSSGGKDSSFLGSKKEGYEVDSILRYYGSGFEYLAVGINKVTGLDNSKNEFNSRHIVAQLFGILALMFAGLTARKLSGWRTAIITIWLLFLSPSFIGHIFFNTKDIPFCAGYIATIYFIIKFLEELPDPKWKTTVGLMLSFAFTTSTRIGGLLLIFYLAIFLVSTLVFNKQIREDAIKNIKSIFIKLVTIVGGGMTLVILTWPYLLKNPLKNLPATLTVVKKFPIKIILNFEGLYTDSLHVPAHYIPKILLITIPVIIIAFILTGTTLYFLKFKQYKRQIGILVIFSCCFPVFYAITTHASLYSGWRHFLFIYPALCILAAIGINEVLNYIKKPALQVAVLLVCLLGLIKPITWSIKNHPYEYTYFNELAGGFKEAFYGYENDYWEITVKSSIDWLMKNEDFVHRADTVVLATNVASFTKYYIIRQYPTAKIRIISSGVTGRNSLYWTYAIYNSLFLKPEYLENFFPPEPCIHTEKIDGISVTAVLKDTARLDYAALQALKASNHKRADSLYMEHQRLTKDLNPANYAYISVAKGSIGQNDEAIAAAKKYRQYNISNILDYNAYCGLGIAYGNKGEYTESIIYLRQAERLLPKENYARDILRQVLYNQHQDAMMKR